LPLIVAAVGKALFLYRGGLGCPPQTCVACALISPHLDMLWVTMVKECLQEAYMHTFTGTVSSDRCLRDTWLQYVRWFDLHTASVRGEQMLLGVQWCIDSAPCMYASVFSGGSLLAQLRRACSAMTALSGGVHWRRLRFEKGPGTLICQQTSGCRQLRTWVCDSGCLRRYAESWCGVG
jgi:hypothetical protein